MSRESMPCLFLRGSVIFPGNGLEIDLGRPSSVDALRAALAVDNAKIHVFTQKDVLTRAPKSIDDLHPIGVTCRIDSSVFFCDGSAKAQLTALRRVRLQALCLETTVPRSAAIELDSREGTPWGLAPFDDPSTPKEDLIRTIRSIGRGEGSEVDAERVARRNAVVAKLQQILQEDDVRRRTELFASVEGSPSFSS